MDIFQAVKTFLEQFCPEVVHVMFPFRKEPIRYEGTVPAITYEFVNVSNQVTHSGDSGIRKVTLDINLWGNLDDIVPMRDGISDVLNGKRIDLSGFEFTVVEKLVQDIFEPNVTFRRILMRYEGVVIG